MTSKANLLTNRGPATEIKPLAAVFGRSADAREPWLGCTPPPVPNSLLTQLETFRVYGELRSTQTTVKNTLPTKQVIDDEKLAIEYDVERRTQPHCINYNEYRQEMRKAGKKVRQLAITPTDLTPLCPRGFCSSDTHVHS